MTVVRPNSISGINSITVATGEALSIHAASGQLIHTLTSASGIATYRGIHVGSGTTTADQGVNVGTGASIVSDTVNELSIYTNNTERYNVNASGSIHVGISTFRVLAGSSPKIGIGTLTPGYTIEAAAASNTTLNLIELTNTVITQVRSNSTGALVRTASNHPIVFGINQNEKARLDTSGRLLINTTASTGKDSLLQVAGTGANMFEVARFVNNAYGPSLHLTKSRHGTVGGNTIVQGDDDLGIINFRGADGAGWILGAEIRAEVDGTPGTNDMPGRLVFATTADGASSTTERLRIDKSGAWGIAGANYGTSGQFLKSGGSGAAVSWGDASGGIDEADIWRLTTSFQGNASGGYIGSNWERADSDGQNHKGTGMTESSGIFSFPSTGFWFVQFTFNMTAEYTPNQPHSHRNTGYINTTIDNSSWAVAASSASGIYNFGSNSYPSHGTGTTSIIFDVTNTTNCKCRFNWGAGQGHESCVGDTSSNQTYVTFIRLADT